MIFSRVRLASPTGLELVWRNVSQSTFQLSRAEGWELESSEHGVLAKHSSHEQPLLLPWGQVAWCETASVGAPVSQPKGKPR